MISVFKKIWLFAGKEQNNIKKSIGLGLLNAIFHALQLYAIFVVLAALVAGNAGKITAFWAVGFMLVSIIGKIITQYYSQLQRVHAGYFMAAGKRIQIGDKLKIVPMGYFNQNSLGNITAVATTILSDVETTAPVVLVTTLGGFINAVVFAVVILLFDWRIGLLVVAAMILFLWVTSLMEKRTRRNILNMISVLLIAMVIRLFPIFMLGYYIIESTKTDEFVAAMEKWRVPEAFVIPISVVFRFIPTLGEESAAITDAMRMRGIQFGTKKFWQAPTAIIEYRIIPLMMSVVKIGDELSAAALTRGLGGLKHRTTIANIGFTFCDAIIALLSAGLLVWALLWGGVLS